MATEAKGSLEQKWLPLLDETTEGEPWIPNMSDDKASTDQPETATATETNAVATTDEQIIVASTPKPLGEEHGIDEAKPFTPITIMLSGVEDDTSTIYELPTDSTDESRTQKEADVRTLIEKSKRGRMQAMNELRESQSLPDREARKRDFELWTISVLDKVRQLEVELESILGAEVLLK